MRTTPRGSGTSSPRVGNARSGTGTCHQPQHRLPARTTKGNRRKSKTHPAGSHPFLQIFQRIVDGLDQNPHLWQTNNKRELKRRRRNEFRGRLWTSVGDGCLISVSFGLVLAEVLLERRKHALLLLVEEPLQSLELRPPPCKASRLPALVSCPHLVRNPFHSHRLHLPASLCSLPSPLRLLFKRRPPTASPAVLARWW